MVYLSLREFANFVISRPGGGSDHQTGFRNGKLRRFAIGAVYHFFLWDGLSEKLEHFESTTEIFGIKKSKFFIENFTLKIQLKKSKFFDLKKYRKFSISKFSVFIEFPMKKIDDVF